MRELVRQDDQRRPAEMPRISVRYNVSGVTMRWSPPRGGRLMPNKPHTVEAELRDLSVAGALIFAPINNAIKVGRRIPIDLSGEPGVVEVRNVRPDPDGENAYYGVTFHEITDELRDAVYEAVSRLRNDARLQSEWNRP